MQGTGVGINNGHRCLMRIFGMLNSDLDDFSTCSGQTFAHLTNCAINFAINVGEIKIAR